MDNYEIEYNEGVDYSRLKKHRYRDQPGIDYFTCPRCGGEYIASFIYNEGGQIMCIDCANKN